MSWQSSWRQDHEAGTWLGCREHLTFSISLFYSVWGPSSLDATLFLGGLPSSVDQCVAQVTISYASTRDREWVVIMENKITSIEINLSGILHEDTIFFALFSSSGVLILFYCHFSYISSILWLAARYPSTLCLMYKWLFSSLYWLVLCQLDTI